MLWLLSEHLSRARLSVLSNALLVTLSGYPTLLNEVPRLYSNLALWPVDFETFTAFGRQDQTSGGVCSDRHTILLDVICILQANMPCSPIVLSIQMGGNLWRGYL